jgi:hypothetical protein
MARLTTTEGDPLARSAQKTEPAVRSDGKCYVCKSERPELAVKVGDPFCSSKCCQQHYAVVTTTAGLEEPE